MPPGRCHPVYFPLSPEADQIRWGGGGSSRIFFQVAADKMNQISSVPGDFFTFPGDLKITRHFWRLTEIQEYFPGLLTHSTNVTTSIHCRKKHLPNVWGLRHWFQTRTCIIIITLYIGMVSVPIWKSVLSSPLLY